MYWLIGLAGKCFPLEVISHLEGRRKDKNTFSYKSLAGSMKCHLREEMQTKALEVLHS